MCRPSSNRNQHRKSLRRRTVRRRFLKAGKRRAQATSGNRPDESRPGNLWGEAWDPRGTKREAQNKFSQGSESGKGLGSAWESRPGNQGRIKALQEQQGQGRIRDPAQRITLGQGQKLDPDAADVQSLQAPQSPQSPPSYQTPASYQSPQSPASYQAPQSYQSPATQQAPQELIQSAIPRPVLEPSTKATTSSRMSFNASRAGGGGKFAKTKGVKQSRPGAPIDPISLEPLEEIDLESLSTESILKQLEKISPETLFQADKQQKKTIIFSAVGVVALVIIAVVSTSMNLTDVAKWSTRACFLVVPLSIIFGISTAVKLLLKHSPIKAQKLYSMMSWGDPRDIAISYIDSCDYLSAEKVLEKACKSMNAKQASQYLSSYGLLGVIHAYTGRTDQAEQIIRQSLEVCEANYRARKTDSNSRLLALALSYSAELSELKGNFAESLLTYTRALQLNCSQMTPSGATIVSALANVGHLQNVSGKFSEALQILRKGKEIADRLPDTRESVKAFLLTNLGTACRGLNDLDGSEKYFHEAIVCANGPLGQRESGRVFYDLARLYVTEEQHDLAGQYYAKAIAAYESWKPVSSPEFLRVLKEYAYYLRATDRIEQAELTKTRSAQMQQTLLDINRLHQGEVKKIRAKVVRGVANTIKRPRFPVFWLLFFLFEVCSVYLGGLRVAPYSQWLWLIASLAVLTLKLKNKYSPPSRLELSQGASVAIMSMIPFARSVLPELAQQSKRDIGIFVGVVLCLLGGVKLMLVPPNTVPQGLLPFEYLCLGQNLISQEQFNLAKTALGKAGSTPEAIKIVHRQELTRLPKIPQPDAAIEANLHAKSELKTNPEAAEKEWRECVAKYPDFEAPYIHLAKDFLKGKDKKAQAQDAEALLNEVLAKNPNCHDAILAMSEVKSAEGDSTASLEYAKKALLSEIKDDDATEKSEPAQAPKNAGKPTAESDTEEESNVGGKANEVKTPEAKAPDAKTAGVKTTEAKTTDQKTTGVKTTEAKTTDAKNAKSAEPAAAAQKAVKPAAKSDKSSEE